MIALSDLELWFVTGSQHLYGEQTLNNVAAHSQEICQSLNLAESIPVGLKYKGVVTTPSEAFAICEKANTSSKCIGIVFWMHTFSPAKMWVSGLQLLNKPMLHLHTQYNAEIPWSEIDMDFMNENQSAHGGREFGFMVTRLRKNRKVIVGHWQNEKVHHQLGEWSRVAAGWHALQKCKVARIGDNMREVAVTEGDKLEAQMRLGFSVNGYGIGDLIRYIDDVAESQVEDILKVYTDEYKISSKTLKSVSLKEAARIEVGLRSFLKNDGFGAFTDTFENLYGLHQLPGIATQRLMADGYGFGAEGDWKTAALLHAIKVMDQGLKGGSSFMEDYTYDFQPNRSRVLGSHMLEICPSIASGTPACEIHPLGIGGKADPARLVFNVDSGEAINVSLIDMGNRFRLVLNEVQAIKPPQKLPKLPVARVLWDPYPDLETAAEAWILAGGAHHTVFSKAIHKGFIEDLAEMAGIELVIIDRETQIHLFKEQLRNNEVYYHLFQNHY